jgi:formylglycine-generating enzyme required for sulfatase activity/dienelactone hydrolase
MSSLIEGYNYDIFISYRQKDNKYDGWVTEFVDHLEKELEATFKEEISVYFDLNPRDYLLESYEVDASLKDKLKCLIFIPVISRTYCDPKSFAWEYEFKAFIDQASKDQFGLKIKLPNGNIANRVLPIRIHDLDEDDLKQCELVLGGVLRGIEFIYKAPGVNRSLSPKDNEEKNLNNTNYRNQINKVALTAREIIESMKFQITHDKVKGKQYQVIESKKEINIKKTEEKEIVKQKQEVGIERIKFKKKQRFRPTKRSRILIPGILASIVIFMGLIFFLERHFKTKWAKETALPQIERLIDKSDIPAAFRLVQKAGKYILNEPKFQELSSLVTSDLTFLTDPAGAEVYVREYAGDEGKWEKLGKTPISNVKVPGSKIDWTSVLYQVRMEKQGYENVLAVISTIEDTLYRKLFKVGEIPQDMVYVQGIGGFLIDRYEVTNKQYKEFVDKGGYENQKFWGDKFIKDGKTISPKEAMNLFVDKTGRPGPSTWEAGDYLDEQDSYPVSGISWYEAAAYAKWAGKDLPSADHWGSAAQWHYMLDSKIIPNSNFKNIGPEPVGKNPGINSFGAYDMAGNVREWCWNETPDGHIIRGGAWNDASYLYSYLSQLPSFDRSPKNGFRCVQYPDKEKIPENTFKKIQYSEVTDFSKIKPVEDKIFTIFKNQFLYDKTELNSREEEIKGKFEDWNIEKIIFNSAYGKEKVISYLFLPRHSSPPFQTLIFFPGMGSTMEKDLINSADTKSISDYLLKSGRAVMFPIYKGTFDRIDEKEPVVLEGRQTREWIIKWVKDFSRSIDYLETRSDIDCNKLGYYGYSLGGLMGGIIPSLDNRLKVNILIVGGLAGDGELVSYVSRIKIPTLMLNGKYDFTFPFDKTVKPFYEFIATQANDKKLVLYETDHYVPRNEMIKEVLAFCDKYLGSVK